MTFEVPPVAQRQAGVFTAEQAVAAGWSARQVRRRLDAGRWRRVAGRGLARGGPSEADLPGALAWAAQLTWPEAVTCRRVAAAVLGLPVACTGTVEVLAGSGRRAWGPLRPVTGAAGDVLTVGGLRVTGRHRTVVDCLAFLPFEEASSLYAWLVSRDRLGREVLVAATVQAFGRPGAPQLRRLLAATRGGALSPAELRLHRLLRGAGLEGWEANVRIAVAGRVIALSDVLFARARLVVEIDGLAAHATAERLAADLRRQNALIGAGYRVLRYTWADLVADRGRVVGEIRCALEGPWDPGRPARRGRVGK